MIKVDQQFRDITQTNYLLANSSPQETIAWVFQNTQKSIVSTSFGPNSAVLLHMVTQQNPDIPVIWVDSGYNTNPTYKFALELIERLKLNMKIFTPKSTSAFLNVKMNGIPDIETSAHEEFTQTVKLEPFNRALDELKPDAWLSGIRSEETEFRRTLNIVTNYSDKFIKVAPLLNWTEQEINNYISKHDLPIEKNYFDPTKSFEARECGLHTRL